MAICLGVPVMRWLGYVIIFVWGMVIAHLQNGVWQQQRAEESAERNVRLINMIDDMNCGYRKRFK